jgi:hypothetical protein
LTVGFGRRALPCASIARIGHLQRLEIGRDMKGLDIDELANAVLLEPGKKAAHGPVIGPARVVVLDRGREKSRKRRDARSPASAIIAGTASEIFSVDVATGVAVSTTAGRLPRSSLTPTP